ncbi:MAG: hypothetical protein NT133_01100 [Alphaproteobacteria bacterium]|nr:hypothetical protein [Alphaproteobacteria bacterium]
MVELVMPSAGPAGGRGPGAAAIGGALGLAGAGGGAPGAVASW